VAYGPEAIVLVLAAAGASALRLTLPVTLAIAGLLAVLVVSYCHAVLRARWDDWNPGVRLDILDSPHRSLVHPIVGYVRCAQQPGRQVAVLITEVQPRGWRYRVLQNQRGLLLATVLRASTDAVICTIPYRLTSR
jgi:hypothetical protein